MVKCTTWYQNIWNAVKSTAADGFNYVTGRKGYSHAPEACGGLESRVDNVAVHPRAQSLMVRSSAPLPYARRVEPSGYDLANKIKYTAIYTRNVEGKMVVNRNRLLNFESEMVEINRRLERGDYDMHLMNEYDDHAEAKRRNGLNGKTRAELIKEVVDTESISEALASKNYELARLANVLTAYERLGRKAPVSAEYVSQLSKMLLTVSARVKARAKQVNTSTGSNTISLRDYVGALKPANFMYTTATGEKKLFDAGNDAKITEFGTMYKSAEAALTFRVKHSESSPIYNSVMGSVLAAGA